MKELRCSMNNCHYNKGYCCQAKEVSVDRNVDCRTYAPEGAEVNESNIMFEAGMDGFSQRAAETKIFCEAGDCVFNEDELCIANGISVISQKREPVCASYCRS